MKTTLNKLVSGCTSRLIEKKIKDVPYCIVPWHIIINNVIYLLQSMTFIYIRTHIWPLCDTNFRTLCLTYAVNHWPDVPLQLSIYLTDLSWQAMAARLWEGSTTMSYRVIFSTWWVASVNWKSGSCKSTAEVLYQVRFNVSEKTKYSC